uniref:IS3 family transposase n=1 Tax=Sutterella wadsworthensis TaxID=40545 RepID=UPI001F109AD6
HACRLMGLSRSTFYASQKTTPAQIKTDELAEKISEVQSSCFFTIGRRRMGAVLHKRYGIEVCETTLQRVMSRRGLTARIRQVRKAKPCAGKATRQQLPDNLLNREFQADRPMHRLVTDVTYVPYFENDEWHWGYLSLVQDLFNRAIVAWVYSKKQDVRLGEVVWIFWTDIRVQTMQCGHVLHKMLFTKKTANLDAFNSHLHIIFQRRSHF